MTTDLWGAETLQETPAPVGDSDDVGKAFHRDEVEDLVQHSCLLQKLEKLNRSIVAQLASRRQWFFHVR